MAAKNALSGALVAYVEHLTIGQGRYAGRPFHLQPWQKRFIRGAFAGPGDAALSLARGGGKSTLAAALACATVDVDGPLVEPMAENVVIASSFEQALQIFRHVLHFLRPTLDKYTNRFRVQDSANRASVQDRETGAFLRVLGSDARRLHGLQAKLLLYDEIAQWPDPDKMLAALSTSKGKIPGSKALWIGTRPSSPDHPFEKALNGGVAYAQVHAARPDDPPFSVATWRKANPGLAYLPDLEEQIRIEAKQAKRDPAILSSFRALRLNMGVAETVESLLLDPASWERIERTALSINGRTGGHVLGVDLGSTQAMSAVSAFWPDGSLDALAVVPSEPSLEERGLLDGVGDRYVQMRDRGELFVAGRRVPDVPALLDAALERWGEPVAVACDRYKESELRDALDNAGFPMVPFIPRGQGFIDGGQDVRAFRQSCLSDKVRPVRSLLLRSALAGARVTTDAAGNSKLAIRSQGGRRARVRDDAIAAAILAVAVGSRMDTTPEPDTVSHVVID